MSSADGEIERDNCCASEIDLAVEPQFSRFKSDTAQQIDSA